MPIINNGPVEEPKEEKPKGIIPGGKEGSVSDDGVTVPPPLPPPTGRNWPLILGIVALLVMGIAAFSLIPGGGELLQKKVDAGTVDLQVDRLVRIGGLRNLTNQKISQNARALEAAESRGDKVVSDTLKLVLAQNHKDRAEYQNDYLACLLDLHRIYQQNPSQVQEQFKQRLKSSEDAFKSGNAEVIQTALKLLSEAPSAGPVKEYFAQALETP